MLNTGSYLPLDPQYVGQISARLKHTNASYSDFYKVCEKKNKWRVLIFKSLIACISEIAEGIFFKFGIWRSLTPF